MPLLLENKMESRRHALLPICSGSLGVCCLGLQLVAIASPHWASFWTNNLSGTGITRPGELIYEAGYYGLWSLCFTTLNWEQLPEVKCNLRQGHYDPGKLRYIAGAFAIGNLLLLFIFLCPIPAQLLFLMRKKKVVPVSLRSLTTIKIITSSVGGASAIAAAVIVNLKGNSSNDIYEEQKQWSFGLQIIVIVLAVFLLICSSAEHMVSRQYSPSHPQFDRQNNKSMAAISNPAFVEKSPDANSDYITSLYETEVAPIKRSNLKLSSNDVIMPESTTEPLSINTLKQQDQLLLKDKRQKRRSSEETSSMMHYSNPEFRNSLESGLDDDSEVFQSKSDTKEKPTYYFGGSSNGSASRHVPSPGYSVGNLSNVTARSTDV